MKQLENLRPGIIIQARTGSSRLRAKVLKKINNKTILEIMLSRIKDNNFRIIVATTFKKQDDKIYNIAKKCGVNVFRGSEKNVLKRYYDAKKFHLTHIIRLTSDCPLIDKFFVKFYYKKYLKFKNDYFSNVIKRTFPKGFDFEIFTFKTLKYTHLNSKSNDDKEHVTQYMMKNKKFKKKILLIKSI